MKLIAGWLLVVLLWSSPTWAQQTRMRSAGLFGAGLALSGTGLAVMTAGLWMRPDEEADRSRERHAMIYGGAAVLGVGLVMTFAGRQRVVIAPSLTGVRVRVVW